MLSKHTFPLNLIPIRIKSFDIIIGMDWMSINRDDIFCVDKHILIPFSIAEPIYVNVVKLLGSLRITSMMKEHKCLVKGCVVFLDCAKKSPKKTMSLSNVKVVRYYDDVFLNYFPGFPPSH